MTVVCCVGLIAFSSGCIAEPEPIEEEELLDEAPALEPQDQVECIMYFCASTCNFNGWNSRQCNTCWNLAYRTWCEPEQNDPNGP
jgi:hypothetical protein